MIFELPFATPSNNVIMRMHHRERSAEHSRYKWLVYSLIGSPHSYFEKCTITITRHGNRLLDWDNMGGGLKFLLDAMVKTEIIKDDNPKCVLSLDLRQVKCKRKEEKTVVEID